MKQLIFRTPSLSNDKAAAFPRSLARSAALGMSVALGLFAWPARTADDDAWTLRDLFRQCSAAQSCHAGDKSGCTPYAARCLDYVDGVAAPLQFACLATHDGVHVPSVLASETSDTQTRVSAIVKFGKAHPDKLGMTKAVGAVVAITSELPCVSAPPGTLTH